MTLSEKIVSIRKAHGWSQEDFAEKLNVSRQAISRWENGTALPDAQNVLQISKLFGVTTDYLLGHTVITKPNIINQIKKHTGTISFILYMVLLIIFLYNMMIFTINCARGVTWSIRPLFYFTPAEYVRRSRHLVMGWHNFEYALVWMVAAAVAYVLMTLIRKRDEKK